MIIHYKISAYLHNQLRELDEGPLVVVGHHHSEACVGGVSQVDGEVVHVSFSFFVLLSFEKCYGRFEPLSSELCFRTRISAVGC